VPVAQGAVEVAAPPSRTDHFLAARSVVVAVTPAKAVEGVAASLVEVRLLLGPIPAFRLEVSAVAALPLAAAAAVAALAAEKNSDISV
jgi:hypothetical protein